MLSKYIAGGPSRSFRWSFGNGYTMQLVRCNDTITANAWSGNTTNGTPVSLSCSSSAQASATSIGLVGAGGSVYFDSLSVIPEPSSLPLLGLGMGLWPLVRRTWEGYIPP